MDQISIVHIPAVAFNTELLLDNVVQLVRQHERGVLRDLTPETVPDGAEVVEECVGQLPRPGVMYPALELPLHGPVLGRAEVILEVEDENSARKPVPAVVPLQVAGEAVHREVDTLSFSAGPIIINTCGLEYRSNDLIAERPLNDPFADMHASDMPPFSTVVKLELIKALAFIGAVHKLASGLFRVRDNAHSVALGRAFPAHVFAANMACGVEVLVGKDVLEVAAGLASRSSSLLSLLYPTSVSGLMPVFAGHRNWSPPYSMIVGHVF